MVQGAFSSFTDNAQLGDKHIVVSEDEKLEFLNKMDQPYLQSVIDHINVRMEAVFVTHQLSLSQKRN